MNYGRPPRYSKGSLLGSLSATEVVSGQVRNRALQKVMGQARGREGRTRGIAVDDRGKALGVWRPLRESQ